MLIFGRTKEIKIGEIWLHKLVLEVHDISEESK